MKAWCQTDVGLRRENNQDYFLVEEDLGLFIVADGMGGHRGGEVASRLAAETVRDIVRKSAQEGGSRKVNPRVLLVQAYEEASKRIFDASQQPGTDLAGMGTTLVVALVRDGVAYIANVGDSRAYLFTDQKLWQITEDHSLLNEQLRAGIISERDAERFTAKNVITRSVGFEREVDVDVIEREIQPGEMLLMCSDGLSGLVPDGQITEICKKFQPSEIVQICVDQAKKNGGDDNVTVMVIYAQSRTIE
jgi:serine/threonine protein phosphatase PrpC